MNLSCVIHRFGPDIAGGSETHCRLVAEHLAERHDVTILTTCARDHVTWRNEYPAGESAQGRLKVIRFPVSRTRSLHRFADISERVFGGRGSEADEEQWFRENGPDAPELLRFLEQHGASFDRVLFWAFRYATSFFGLPLVKPRAILVPTAEDDPVIRFEVLGRLFSRAAGFLFLTPEEQWLVERRADGPLAPFAVVGSGLDPATPRDRLPRVGPGVPTPFVLYLGRIDPNKGCETLLQYFRRYVSESDGAGDGDPRGRSVHLVMAGPANMPVPEHPNLTKLGLVDEAVRERLLAHASLLVVPSPYESLSLVLLEAWNHEVPALVNGRCRVLRGQAERSNGALWYRNYDEFAACLTHVLNKPSEARTLGRQGLDYVNREYRWPLVMARIEDLLKRTLRT
jgi:glycosyltransferase involved in cell wall biosynthesis